MKSTYWIVTVVAVIAGLSVRLLGQPKRTAIEIRKITPLDSEILEEWVRVTSEKDLLGVSAVHTKLTPWNWQVSISVAEFVRKGPLAARLETVVTSAIKTVKGVKAVVREDTEVWTLQGDPKGEELVRSCSSAVDQMASELRKYKESLMKGPNPSPEPTH